MRPDKSDPPDWAYQVVELPEHSVSHASAIPNAKPSLALELPQKQSIAMGRIKRGVQELLQCGPASLAQLCSEKLRVFSAHLHNRVENQPQWSGSKVCRAATFASMSSWSGKSQTHSAHMLGILDAKPKYFLACSSMLVACNNKPQLCHKSCLVIHSAASINVFCLVAITGTIVV